MEWSFGFVANSLLLGVGLAMDAFSVSLADVLSEPDMSRGNRCAVAGVFAFFQALMPMTGWFFVRTAVRTFSAVERFIPWIALALLTFLGGKMILEARRAGTAPDDEPAPVRIGFGALMSQGVATSIDALSVGFTVSGYDWRMALAASLIIAAVTFALCAAGVLLGRRFGTRLAGKAQWLGGSILIAIGIEILITGLVG